MFVKVKLCQNFCMSFVYFFVCVCVFGNSPVMSPGVMEKLD